MSLEIISLIWEANIKMDLKENRWEVSELINLTRDSDKGDMSCMWNEILKFIKCCESLD
jgi:hypothetical protein